MRPFTDLTIIVPVLNEANGIVVALQALVPLRRQGAEVIVVDGGSSDATLELVTSLADHVLTAPRGRASQMNAGAALAQGRVLLFLHADTVLPDDADHFVRQILELIDRDRSRRQWGRFDVRIAGRSPWLRLVATMMNWRSRLTGIATGDQAMFVSRSAFQHVGGFPDISLMEDIALSTLLLKVSRPVCLAARVTTSGRRWETHGVWRTIVFMAWLRLRYFFGADPHCLAIEYGYAPPDP